MLIIEKLTSKENMSDTEIAIADFIIFIGKNINKSSTRSIAEATYTSPTTIIRFCKKMGFSGFDEFKNEYIKELDYLNKQYGKIDANFPFEKTDSELKVANKISSLYIDTVNDTMTLLNYSSIKQAINLIKLSDSIHIFSYGTTLNTAEVFKRRC